MPTPKLFEQITGGIVNSAAINPWIRALLPSGTHSNLPLTGPSAAWLDSIQSVLEGSDVLRHMQIDAIHNTQKRTSQLARSLAHATSPLDAGKAWQQFSADNLQNTMEYWTAYREILQDTEIRMLNHAERSINSAPKVEAALVRPVRSAKQNHNTKVRARRKVSASH